MRDFAMALLAGERPQVDASLAQVLPQRKWASETDAGISVTVPTPAQTQPQTAQQEATQDEGVEGEVRPHSPRRVGNGELQPVLEHPVVVEAHGHEYDIAEPLRVEARDHVAQYAEL